VISLLYTVDGLGAVLSLNDRGWEWVLSRAGDIGLYAAKRGSRPRSGVGV
jgi:hypothetical protein